MPSEFIAVIDETGCTGARYNQGSSHFLAMGAVVYRRSNAGAVLNVFSEGRLERGKQNTFRKFSKSHDKDNFVLTRGLANKPVKITCVAFHKPSLDGGYVRTDHQKLYNYLLKMTVERISWIARDAEHGVGQDNRRCRLVLSESEMYPVQGMQGYLDRLRAGDHNTRTAWAFIDQEIEIEPHADEERTHLADLAASAFGAAIEPKQHGMTDDRFIRNLGPKLYRGDNGTLYGVKLFPKVEIDQLRTQGHLGVLDIL